MLGYLAGFLGTVSFLPQVIKSWKTKKTHDISLLMFVVLGLGVLLWVIYGLLTNQVPISLWNGVVFVLVSSLVFLKLKYG